LGVFAEVVRGHPWNVVSFSPSALTVDGADAEEGVEVGWLAVVGAPTRSDELSKKPKQPPPFESDI
jgi:hypothetical protein